MNGETTTIELAQVTMYGSEEGDGWDSCDFCVDEASDLLANIEVISATGGGAYNSAAEDYAQECSSWDDLLEPLKPAMKAHYRTAKANRPELFCISCIIAIQTAYTCSFNGEAYDYDMWSQPLGIVDTAKWTERTFTYYE